MDLDKIFLGITPTNQRRFVHSLLSFTAKERPILIMPAVGTFVLTRVAIEAGYKPENIYTSDISLFSALLGYYFEGKSIDSLNLQIVPEIEGLWFQCTTEVEKIALLLWYMKIKQLTPEVVYEGMYYDEFMLNAPVYIKQLVDKLESMKLYFGGIHYETKDLRDYLNEAQPENSIVLNDPPIYSKGYEKMFKFEKELGFESGIEEFDLKKEYMNFYELSRRRPEPWFWSKYFNADGVDPKEVIYGNQKDAQRVDYWLCTKPEILANFENKYKLDLLIQRPFVRFNAPLFSSKDQINEDSVISFKQVDANVALYYRELFTHNLGSSIADTYYLMFIDGKIFGSIGLGTRPLFSLLSDCIQQTFAMSTPVTGDPRANRLVLRAITTQQFADMVKATASGYNRIYNLRGMRTTVFSHYRKQKAYNGLMKIVVSEKDEKTGIYRLVYETEFRKETYQQVVKDYLKEYEQWKLTQQK